MATWKTTFYFESFEPTSGIGGGAAVGWTETWYQTGPSSADLALTSAAIDTYIMLRRQCLAYKYNIPYVRVSDAANPRNSKLKSLEGRIGQAGLSAAGILSPIAQVNCALLVDFTCFDDSPASLAHSRRFLLRGLTAADINGNVFDNKSPNFNAIKRFLAVVGNGPVGEPSLPAGILPYWQIRFFDPTTVPIPSFSLASVPQPNDHFIHATAPGLVPTLGKKYRIRGVRYPYYSNRVWTDTGFVDAANPTTIELGRSRRRIAGTWDGSGQLLPLVYGYKGSKEFNIIGLRNRQTGRPSHLTRGRRNPVV
jgi:hypothetical protein